MLADVGDTPRIPKRYRDDASDLFDPASVTGSLKAPDGTITSLAVAHTGLGTFVASPVLTVTGEWLVTITATGPADVYEVAVFAKPVGEIASWAPTPGQVGQHIPSRTRQTAGDNEPAETFNDLTYPTGDTVEGIIGSAVATVAGLVGKPIAQAAFPLSSTAAALWAAYWVELGYPERDADVAVYGRLRDDAVMLTEQAKAVNLGAGGGTQDPPDEDGLPDALSSFAFDCPPRALIL